MLVLLGIEIVVLESLRILMLIYILLRVILIDIYKLDVLNLIIIG